MGKLRYFRQKKKQFYTDTISAASRVYFGTQIEFILDRPSILLNVRKHILYIFIKNRPLDGQRCQMQVQRPGKIEPSILHTLRKLIKTLSKTISYTARHDEHILKTAINIILNPLETCEMENRKV